MPFTPLVTAGIKTALNTFLWRDKALKPARQRLLGKVLRVQLQDFATPVVLVFSERQVDVLSAWDGEADCTVITRLSVLTWQSLIPLNCWRPIPAILWPKASVKSCAAALSFC